MDIRRWRWNQTLVFVRLPVSDLTPPRYQSEEREPGLKSILVAVLIIAGLRENFGYLTPQAVFLRNSPVPGLPSRRML